MKIAGATILVTGGTSGIGRGLAEALHKDGAKVIVAGRSQERLDAIVAENPGMAAMALDIADAKGVDAFARRLLAEHPDLDVLINNAGVLILEDKIDLAAMETTVATNFLGPVRLTAALLPHLLSRPGSTIVNVSSSHAFIPAPHAPAYGATKAAMHSWTFALRAKLRSHGVEVIEIIPPGVQTELIPGMAEIPHCMPLDAFVAEVMGLLRREPTPAEICVENALPARAVVDDARIRELLASWGVSV